MRALSTRVFLRMSDALVVAWALLVSACAHDGIPSTLVRHVSLQERDVVAAVVEDLRGNAGCRLAADADAVAVNRYMIPARDLASDEWLEHALDADAWMEMAPLLPGLREHGEEEGIVDWELPESAHVLNRDLSGLGERERARLEASVRCWASFMRPAISDDAARALVVLHVGPSPHGALALYALRRSASGWSIAAGRFIEYL
jgi:hypothetical protein